MRSYYEEQCASPVVFLCEQEFSYSSVLYVENVVCICSTLSCCIVFLEIRKQGHRLEQKVKLVGLYAFS